MPTTSDLPKGCSTLRGVSDIRHTGPKAVSLPQQANRLYMLTVRRQSLVSKKLTLARQLDEINDQILELDTDIRSTEARYRKLSGRRPRRQRYSSAAEQNGGNGHEVNKVALRF